MHDSAICFLNKFRKHIQDIHQIQYPKHIEFDASDYSNIGSIKDTLNTLVQKTPKYTLLKCAHFFRSSFPFTRIIAALTPDARMYLNSMYYQLKPHKIFSNVLSYLIYY